VTIDVKVIDSTPPVVDCPDDAEATSTCLTQHQVTNEFRDWLGHFSCEDNCGATSTFYVDGEAYHDIHDIPAPDKCGDEVIVKLVCENSCGVKTECTRKFTVPENIDPIIKPTDNAPAALKDAFDAVNMEWPETPVVITYECDQFDGVLTNPIVQDWFKVIDDCQHLNIKITERVTVTDADCKDKDYFQYYLCDITATDDCGNQDKVTIDVKVIDSTPPVVDCPDNAEASSTCLSADALDGEFRDWLGHFSCEDNCGATSTFYVDGEAYHNIHDIPAPDKCGDEVIVKLVCENSCGVTSECSATFTVPENTDPVLKPSANAPADLSGAFNTGTMEFYPNPVPINLECAEYSGNVTVPEVKSWFKVVDDCQDMNIHIQELEMDANGDCKAPNGYLERYLCKIKTTDRCGNMDMVTIEIKVIDSTPPVVDCPDNAEASSTCLSADALDGEFRAWLGKFKCSDDCGATSTFYVDGEDYHNIHDIPAPDKCGDEVTVKLICENSCGKTSECEATFTVPENADPIIKPTANAPAALKDAFDTDEMDFDPDPVLITFECDEVSGPLLNTTVQGWFMVSDDCQQNLKVRIHERVTITDADCKDKDYFQYYLCDIIATDDCGNEDKVTIDVKVIDSTPPVVDCPDNAEASSTCLSADALDGEFRDWLRKFSCTDNCGATSTFYVDGEPYHNIHNIPAPDKCGDEVTVKLVCENSCGVTSECEATFTVPENTDPVLKPSANAPADLSGAFNTGTMEFYPNPVPINLECAEYSGNVTVPEVKSWFKVVDDCQDMNIHIQELEMDANGDCKAPNGYLERYLCKIKTTDRCGNMDMVTIEIKVIDSTPPVVDCPDNAEASSTCLSADALDGEFRAWLGKFKCSDDCGATSTFYVDGEDYHNIHDIPAPDKCGDEVTVKLICENSCGKTSECEATFTVPENTDPVLKPSANAPTDLREAFNTGTMEFYPNPVPINLNCAEYSGNVTVREVKGWFKVIDDCQDMNIHIQELEMNPNGDCDGVDGYLERYLCKIKTTDRCGNMDMVTIEIKVVDNKKPTITHVGPDGTFECGTNPVFSTPRATDDCDEHVTLTFVDTNGPTTCAGTAIIRTWTATDDCGNYSTASQTLTPVDTKDPVLEEPDPIADINCDDPLPVQQTLKATDDCSHVTVTPSVDPYEVDVCKGYSITYRWTAVDACDNMDVKTVTFKVLPDTKDPVLEEPDPIADINCNDPLPLQQTLKATDDCSHVTVTPSVDPYEVDVCKGYSITYRWTAVDACDNMDVKTVTFKVLPDTKDPVLEEPDPIADINCDDPLPVQQTLKATDDCSHVTVTPSVDPYEVDVCKGYSITYRWTAVDACDNMDVKTVTFKVLPDTKDPVLEEPDPIADINCNDPLPLQQTLKATDDCSHVTVTPSVDPYEVDVCKGYSITYRWKAEDACGNMDEKTVTFKVLPDTKDPVLEEPDPIADINCNDPLPLQQALKATDDCSRVTVTPSVDPYEVDVCKGYSITYRWTAVDACDNMDVKTVTFKVLPDTKDPVLEEPDPIADINCDDPLPVQQTLKATDDCSHVTVTPSVDPYEVDVCKGYSITYRWTAVDACDNMDVKTVTFKVLPDTKDPVLEEPDPIADINCDDPLPVQQTLKATDDCSHVTVTPSVDPYEVDVCKGYSITYRWTAVDACDNMDVKTVTFKVLPDTKDPVLEEPDPIADINCDDPLPVQQTLKATDDCSHVTVTPSVDPYEVDVCKGYSITYRWKAEDACGNMDEKTVTFKVLPDTKDPVLEEPDPIADINCNDPLPLQQALKATDDCSHVTVTPSVDPYEVDVCKGYSITYRWKAEDACGNMDEKTVTFKVLPDTKDPVLEEPDPIADINCDDPLPVQQTLKATDDCSHVTVTPSVDPYEVDVCKGYSITYRWTAVDACDNMDVKTVTFKVLPDTKDPVLEEPDPIADINCDDPLPAQQTLTATDDCSQVTVTPSVDPYEVDVCKGYSITYRWTAVDACDNMDVKTVTFKVLPDTKDPVLEEPDPIADINCDDPLPAQQTLTATDDCSQVTVTPSVDPYEVDVCKGYSITYRWKAEDACGNISEKHVTFKVLPDTKDPVLEEPDPIADINCDDPLPAQQTLTATDVCSQVTVTPSVDPYEVDVCKGYSITYRWKAEDACGNMDEKTVTFNVLPDTESPDLEEPSDLADINCNDPFPVQETLTATDDCSQVTVTPTVDDYTVDVCNGYTVTYRWTAVDACGNEDEESTSFRVLPDTKAPTITPLFSSPAPNGTMIVECNNADPNWNPFTMGVNDVLVEDDCSNVQVTFKDELLEEGNCGDCDFLSLWSCTWTATDECGNESSLTIFMKIVDTTPPVPDPNFPTELTVECDNIPPAEIPDAVDACSSVTTTMTESVIGDPSTGAYDIVRSYTFTDASGKASTLDQVVHVVDNTAPILYLRSPMLRGMTNGDRKQLNCEEKNQLYSELNDVLAFDNCDPDPSVSVSRTSDNFLDCEYFGYSYLMTVTYTAVDAQGNVSTTELFFEMIDNTPPELRGVPEDACVDELPEAPQVFAVDACSSPIVTMEESAPEPCGDGGMVVVRTWTATDRCGNASSESQEIIISPPGAASIAVLDQNGNSIAAGGTITMEADCKHADFKVEEYILANIDDSGSCGLSNLSVEVADAAEGDCLTDGYLLTANVSITATDICGNPVNYGATVEVVDQTGPTFSNLEATDMICGGMLDIPTAQDLCSGVDTIFGEWIDDPRASCDDQISTYTYLWTAIDGCGNVSTAEQEVTIKDFLGPIFRNLPDAECADEILPGDVIAFDECNGVEVEAVLSVSTSTLEGCGELVTYTWTATDACGNTSVAQRYQQRADVVAPTVVATHPRLDKTESGDEVTLDCPWRLDDNGFPSFGDDAVAATDNCPADVEVMLNVTRLSTIDCGPEYLGRYQYDWTATDACGNSSTYTLFITFADRIAPHFHNTPPAQVTFYCDDEMPELVKPDVFDHCGEVDVQFTTSRRTTTDGFLEVRSWLATDDCGNSRTFEQVVEYIDRDITAEFKLEGEELNCGSTGNALTVIPDGGQAPYTYDWSMVDCDGFITDGADEPTVIFTGGYKTQNFEVVVTDANGCQEVFTISIGCMKLTDSAPGTVEGTNIEVNLFGSEGGLKAYPNPTQGNVFLSLPSWESERVDLTVLDPFGRAVLARKVDSWPAGPVELDLSQLPQSTYVIRVRSASGLTEARQVVVLRP
jgi:hypothetical protein